MNISLDRVQKRMKAMGEEDVPADIIELTNNKTKDYHHSLIQRKRITFWRVLSMNKLVNYAAAAVAVIVVIVGYHQIYNINSISDAAFPCAFCDVLDEIENAYSFSYKETFHIGTESEYTITRMVMNPAYLRSQMPNGSILIQDFNRNRSLQLWPDQGKAVVVQHVAEKLGEEPFDYIDWIDRLQEGKHQFEKLDNQEITGGEVCDVYCIQGDFAQNTVWVSPLTNIPVQVEHIYLHPDKLIPMPETTPKRGEPGGDEFIKNLLISGSSGLRGKEESTVKSIVSEFVWNANHDEKLFSLEPPDEYDDVDYWMERTIDDNFPSIGIRSIDHGDIDDDGDIDILVGGGYFGEGGLYWYENRGDKTFTAHCVTNSGDHKLVKLIDMDFDGHLDSMTIKEYIHQEGDVQNRSRGLYLWINDGQQKYSEHEIVPMRRDSFITTCFADINGDGDVDVLFKDGHLQQISWLENTGNISFEEHIIEKTPDIPAVFTTIDMDNDGDIDVVGHLATEGESEDDNMKKNDTFSDIYLWDNNGERKFTRRSIVRAESLLGTHVTVDIDLDGDGDLLTCSSDPPKVFWIENIGAENNSEHVISRYTEMPVGMCAADVDGDGDIDIMGADQYRDSIILWENVDDQKYLEHYIKLNYFGAYLVSAADIDSDSDLDLYACSIWNGKFLWWESIDSDMDER